MGATPATDQAAARILGAGEPRARHVAIIMDGNGRWAKKRGLPRAVGHQRGVEAVRRLVRGLEPMKLECLTLYAFSSENWKRSHDEVDDLMNLMRRFIKSDLEEFVANGVKLKIIGDWRSLAPDIVAMLEDALARTANGRQILAVALNYGGKHEIARAAAKAAAKGAITPEAIEAQLDTHDLPPLDLLIRTSGEIRLSNFLLWQAAYAEMLFVDTLWPDFKPEHLQQALDDFARRERRYGGR
ncbi:undecaprenyl diphosphate synthase [Erythrobacter litoralis]|jgi:undecaprenyl diphosphate synthase|uniref:Isoprenyl transferase n=1 Tax=Erythrobacter litoralis TaxID=39960 RepID=A0A074N124_9SPHN|nr:undecaprenyl diphosphate synthase [Erythrobacter litoralis]KEO98605.1 UDP pyrophosphate synthase [Erythrobacter litoralis]